MCSGGLEGHRNHISQKGGRHPEQAAHPSQGNITAEKDGHPFRDDLKVNLQGYFLKWTSDTFIDNPFFSILNKTTLPLCLFTMLKYREES